MGGGAFLDATTPAILDLLYRSANHGKLLITSRYPVPGSEAWLEPCGLGPLTPAQTRKLFYRLTELKDRPPEVLGKVLRLIGGHPRMLEYLDAILRKGTGRLPIVEEKLRENVMALGVRIEDLGEDLEESVQDAIRVGAQDILLTELLKIIDIEPGDRKVLEQASVFPMPVDVAGLAIPLGAGDQPAPGAIEWVRKAVDRLGRTSLVTPLEDDSLWVHRWTAEALKKSMEPTVYREYCRRAGELLQRRVEQGTVSIRNNPLEAVRLLLQGEAFDRAMEWAGPLLGTMRGQGQTLAALSFCEDVLSVLPVHHAFQPGLLREAADIFLTLGLTEKSAALYGQAMATNEERIRKEPNRADYLRDLSVSYERMGDLHRALGQGDSASEFYQKDLEIAERLALQEPQRADYQIDLYISLSRVAQLEAKSGPEYMMRAISILEALDQRAALPPPYKVQLEKFRELSGNREDQPT